MKNMYCRFFIFLVLFFCCLIFNINILIESVIEKYHFLNLFLICNKQFFYNTCKNNILNFICKLIIKIEEI